MQPNKNPTPHASWATGLPRESRDRREASRRSGRVLATALFAATVLSGCYVYNSTLYLGDHQIVVLSGAATGTPPSRGSTQHRSRRKDLAAGSYTLASSTPFYPFAGNRSFVVTPVSGTAVSQAILQRGANCTITETVVQPVNGYYDTRSTLDLPNAQDWFHQLVGLSTTPDVFPHGCADTTRGKRSVFTAQPISVTSTLVRSVDVNPSSEKLEVQTIDRTANTLSTTTLTSGRVSSFSVVDLNGDGLNDIVAAGVGYGPGNAGSIVVFLNNGDGTFRTAATIANNGSTFVVDDVNGDGKADIVIDNGYDANGIQVPGVSTLLGNGDGTFRAAVASAAAVTNVSGPMVTGDFNGDGKPDLLLGQQVLLGVGDGTFTVGPALPAAVGYISFYAAVGDLDHDGKLDVVYTSAGYVQVLLGNGDGTFRVGARYASVGSAQPVAVTEIDGDGNLDIVVGNASQGVFAPVLDNFLPRIQVLLGRGDGTFVGAPIYTASIGDNSSATQYATADFDGDGKLDTLVIDNATTSGLDVLPGDGQGALGAAVRSATAIRAWMLVATDLNGDGKPDVVTAGTDVNGAYFVATLVNQGGGHLGGERDAALPGYPTAIAVGDFDGDGRLDVAVAVGSVSYDTGTNGVYVLYGQADGTLGAAVKVDPSLHVISVAAADVNGDGRADLAFVDSGTNNQAGAVHLLLGRADRTFAATTLPATAATSFGVVALADVNGDGKRDLLVGASVPGTSFGSGTPYLYTYLGNGDGTFQAPLSEATLGTDGVLDAIAVGDFDHDGKVDVAIGIQNDYTEVLLGQGDGTWAHGLLVLGEHPNAIVAADLDNDGYAELLIGTGSGVAVLKNAGTVAAWSAPTGTTTPTSPTSPTTGDFAVTATPASGSIMAGQSVQTIVAVAPSGGFTGTVTLACAAGLPQGASCTFTPASVTVTGSAAVSSSLTIATSTATSVAALDPTHPAWPGGLAFVAFGSLSLWTRRRRERWAALFGTIALAALLTSCGGDDGQSSSTAPPPAPAATATTYPVTITATGASTSHSVTYQLTIH